MATSESAGPDLNWRKSLRSATNGECVEVAPTGGHIVVRDSKAPGGPFLRYTDIQWRNFVEHTKGTGRDLLA